MDRTPGSERASSSLSVRSSRPETGRGIGAIREHPRGRWSKLPSESIQNRMSMTGAGIGTIVVATWFLWDAVQPMKFQVFHVIIDLTGFALLTVLGFALLYKSIPVRWQRVSALLTWLRKPTLDRATPELFLAYLGGLLWPALSFVAVRFHDTYLSTFVGLVAGLMIAIAAGHGAFSFKR